MSEDKNKSLDQTIDALFSEKPSAPVKPAPKADAVKTQSAPSAPSAPRTTAPKATAPKAQGTTGTQSAPKAASTHKMSMTDLQKLINAPRAEKPLEKPSVWTTVLVASALVLSLIIMLMVFVAAYFYFSGAILSQILCVLFGILLVLFNLSCAFVLCRIEKGIREIKTKL